jgi:hypothetical protein
MCAIGISGECIGFTACFNLLKVMIRFVEISNSCRLEVYQILEHGERGLVYISVPLIHPT